MDIDTFSPRQLLIILVEKCCLLLFIDCLIEKCKLTYPILRFLDFCLRKDDDDDDYSLNSENALFFVYLHVSQLINYLLDQMESTCVQSRTSIANDIIVYPTSHIFMINLFFSLSLFRV